MCSAETWAFRSTPTDDCDLDDRLDPFAGPGACSSLRRAVFLDRDGVLNRNVFYSDTQAFESPRTVAALTLTDGVGHALRRLREAGLLLILVSNQPNAAKGKCSREELDRLHQELVSLLAEEGLTLDACFYCYHHPMYSGPCACRKPSPMLLQEASSRFQLDLPNCWMIGDRASDIACGLAVGARTIWVDNDEGVAAPGGAEAADGVARSIGDAVSQLLALPLHAQRG